ncbi:hypothetical protein, partial [Glycomyces dulcitolivorans]|uniref:hypothetical protein n=1 Tax=Glycomyces dulcitolivorans TaxID=2200759 RepID=UPI0013009494
EAVPGSIQARRDLSISYNKLGDLAQEAGDAENASRYAGSALEIARLVWAQAPGHRVSAELLAFTLYRLASIEQDAAETLQLEAAEALEPFATAGTLSALGLQLWQWAADGQ